MDYAMAALLIAIAAVSAIGVLAIRRRYLARIALRNIYRRRTYTAIMTAGLMVATAMISASLVMGDTLDHIITRNYLDELGNVDVVVSVPDNAGILTYFNESIFYENILSARAVGTLPDVDGAGPAIREWAAVLDQDSNVPVPRITLFGIDPLHRVNPLVDENGDRIDPKQISEGGVVIGRELANELNASIGDTLLILTERSEPVAVSLKGIAAKTGLGAWGGAEPVFMDLMTAQRILDKPSMINMIDVSNRGSAEKGYLITRTVVRELESALLDTYDFHFDAIKEDNLAYARASSNQITSIFLVMSSFAIVAGMSLIANVFVVLSEERKSEMGMLRALGLSRGDLTQAFMFEGVVYAVLASIAGALAGLAIAYLMVNAYATVFISSRTSIDIHFEWGSILFAGCAGFLVMLLTVALASWGVSRLNIVKAIGDLPESKMDRSNRSYIVLSALGAVSGATLTGASIYYEQFAGMIVGPCLLVVSMAAMTSRYVGSRVPFTAAGIFVVLLILYPSTLTNHLFRNLEASINAFTVLGFLLVIGGVLVAIFNSDLLLRPIVTAFGRRKSMIPVFRAAIGYPLNKKFRTGLTLLMFALIMFTVVVISMVASFERESVEATTLRYSGGYQIIGYSMRVVPEENLTDGLSHIQQQLPGLILTVESARTSYLEVKPTSSNGSFGYMMIGFNKSILENNEFALQDRSARFSSDAEAWESLEGPDSGFVILDGSVSPRFYGLDSGRFNVNVDDEICLTVYTGDSRNFTVAGIMEQRIMNGVYGSSEVVERFCPTSLTNLFYFRIAPDSSVSLENLARMIEVEYFAYGLQTMVVEKKVSEFLTMVSSILQLSEVFLGIGQVAGIAGIGIVTMRNVKERRQEIGVMRALGYQRNMIWKVFLIEASFVSLLGIVLGVILGIGLSHLLYAWAGFSLTAPFVIPWLEILSFAAIALSFTLASTLPPSLRAAKLSPSEALRRIG